jgi:multidrug efflux pump subunit AcrB
MTTLEDLRVVPVSAGGIGKPLLGDLARIENATIVGEYDRINGQRMVTLTANVAGGGSRPRPCPSEYRDSTCG